MIGTDLTATDEAELEAVEAAIHDWWFDAERIEREGDTVRIPCGPSNDVRHTLAISHVESVERRDEAGIGQYDINRLTYRSGTGELELESGFPFALTVRVRGLHVALLTGQADARRRARSGRRCGG